jgi:flagellar hook-associated protein 2
MAGIQLSGLASGMDTEGMIAQLMAIERLPRQRLTFQQAAVKARQEGLQNIDTKLKALKTAADALASAATWAPTQSVSVNDATRLSARITGPSGPGGYELDINRLATTEQRTYAYTPPAGAETLTIGSWSAQIAAGTTSDALAAQINADAESPVFAVALDADTVIFSGKQTGVGFTATAGSLVEDPLLAKTAQTARYRLDNRPSSTTWFTSNSNTISATTAGVAPDGFIPGVEFTLKSTGNNQFVNVTEPAPDKTVLADKVKAFVEAYNAAMDTMRVAVQEKRVPGATTETDARKGALFADPTVRNIMDSLRGVASEFKGTTGSTSYDELFEIGISTGASTGSGTFSQDAVDGKLVLDSAKLTAALEANPLAVQKLLGAVTGTPGFSQAFGDRVTPYSQAGGIVAQRLEAAGSEITRLGDSLLRMDERLARKEESLRKMFSNLEIALQRSQSQSADLLARLGSLSNEG